LTTDTQREINEVSCEYWADEAWHARKREDKAQMYDLAARAADKFDAHHATVLRRLANHYREGSK